ncbi:Acyl carrier protein familyprotein [Desulfosarcina cetonica]|uniref:acyl carrier protein n=1 Tax=Desulfosarcina cetonica TaxID=90730 RepID=UPI0006D1B72F|nr:phosphopantetheine-binding protein [Desulfosarcina cetonica]VTR69450.1 Acyl carrier protein familyprotein [Desulfosarcina cetonica]
MREEDIDRIVRDLLRQVAPEAPLESLEAQRPFRDQFQFDSVDFLSFILKLEEAAGIKISELDYPALSSLRGCRTYLKDV